MNLQGHDGESQRSSSHDHTHQPRPYWKRAHRDWRMWTVAALMLAVLIAGVMADSLFFGTGYGQTQPMPATNAP